MPRRRDGRDGLLAWIEGAVNGQSRRFEFPYQRTECQAVVICDNTQQFRDAYADDFEFIAEPRNRLRTMTLPFDGGLEFTVRV